MAAVGRSENHAVVANDRADIGIDKINAEEACCLAGLRSPRLPAICRSNNCSAEEAHGGAVIFVAEIHGIKPISRVALLLIPVVATIGCP